MSSSSALLLSSSKLPFPLRCLSNSSSPCTYGGVITVSCPWFFTISYFIASIAAFIRSNPSSRISVRARRPYFGGPIIFTVMGMTGYYFSPNVRPSMSTLRIAYTPSQVKQVIYTYACNVTTIVLIALRSADIKRSTTSGAKFNGPRMRYVS